MMLRNQNHFFLPIMRLCAYICPWIRFLIESQRRIALLVCAVLFLMPANVNPMMANIAKSGL